MKALYVFCPLLLLCFGLGLRAQETNLITNPGFEEGQEPWQLDNWMKNEVSWSRDPGNPHSGGWSMKVELTKVLNGPNLMLAFPHLPLRGQTAVRVRFWARGVSNGANLTVMVRREIEPRITYLRTEMNLITGSETRRRRSISPTSEPSARMVSKT